MEPDDNPDDERFAGAPLPPEDRLWRHPSEAAGIDVRSDRRARAWLGPRLAGLALGAAALGAVAVAAASVLGDDGSGAPADRQAADSVATLPVVQPTGGDPDRAAALTPVVVRVETDDASGSAVLFRGDGHLLTTVDVVDGARSVAITRADGRRTDATVVGVDAVLGVAVLWSGPLEGRAGIPLGQSDEVVVGDRVEAGVAEAPRGVTARSGVVSDLAGSTVDRSGSVRHGLVRVDVPTAGDLGGGPVLNESGELVGLTLGAGASSVTYAVPVDAAVRSGDQIVVDGQAVHAWLGLAGTDLDAARADQLAVPGAALVTEIDEGSPAAEAGLAERDVIVAFDGEAVHSMGSLVVAVRERRAGESVAIRYLRDGVPQRCSAVLSERPA